MHDAIVSMEEYERCANVVDAMIVCKKLGYLTQVGKRHMEHYEKIIEEYWGRKYGLCLGGCRPGPRSKGTRLERFLREWSIVCLH